MRHLRSRAGVGLAATLLASILAASLAATTLALSISNANPSVVVPTGVPTNVGINVTWNGTAPGDTLGAGTTFAVILPAGYTWTALPTFSASPSAPVLAGPQTTGQITTWTLSSFGVTSGAWSLTLSGGQVVTSLTSGTAQITMSVGGGQAMTIARLSASGATGGTLVPVTVSPRSVPADGTSTITVTFGTPSAAATCASYSSFTVATTGGTFSASTLPGVTIPTGGTTSVTVPCANFSGVAGASLTLRAPTTPGRAVITVTLSSALSSATVSDSRTVVTFTSPKPITEREREHARGASKVRFYAGSSACSTSAPTVPPAGTATFGFAVVNATGNGRLTVEVSLKGAAPNATYSISLDLAGTCTAVSRSLHTNARGNGNLHVNLANPAKATQVWVLATQSPGPSVTNGSNSLFTTAATVVLKGHGPSDHGTGKDNPGRGRGHD